MITDFVIAVIAETPSELSICMKFADTDTTVLLVLRRRRIIDPRKIEKAAEENDVDFLLACACRSGGRLTGKDYLYSVGATAYGDNGRYIEIHPRYIDELMDESNIHEFCVNTILTIVRRVDEWHSMKSRTPIQILTQKIQENEGFPGIEKSVSEFVSSYVKHLKETDSI